MFWFQALVWRNSLRLIPKRHQQGDNQKHADAYVNARQDGYK